jgi:TolB-like protein
VATSKPSIAVLPFTNMSADPENEFFADGLTEELLNVLAKNPELKVTGRTSCFAFKGKQEDLRSIGQKLSVGTILEGSVRKAGNRVRITAQLVSVTDGFHLWSETFDRVLDDIFAVQDEIAQSVSKAMHVTLIGVTNERKSVNPESYALCLRAHQSQLLMNAESLESAVELYKKSIAIDGENAKAWAGLALTYAIRIAYGHSDHGKEHPLARKAAEKALALNDQLADSHISMSWVYGALEIKVRDGYPHAKRAFELEPNNCDIVSGMAMWEFLFGNFESAIKLSRKSVELDPLNPLAWRELSRILMFAGELDESMEIANKVLTMSPDMTTLQMGRAGGFALKGDFRASLDAAEKEKLAGYRHCVKAIALYALGESDKCHAELELLKAEGEQWSFQIAMVYAWQGDSDSAFLWLERAYEIHDSGIPLAKVQPFLRNLHTDPRWQVFLRKIGLAD